MNILDYVTSEKELGVNITTRLNWTDHCNKLYSKANQLLGLTKRICHFVNNPKQRRALYLSLIRSQFEHWSVVWRPCHETTLNKLESLQKMPSNGSSPNNILVIHWIMSIFKNAKK